MSERDVDPVYANRPVQVGRRVFEVGQQGDSRSVETCAKDNSVPEDR